MAATAYASLVSLLNTIDQIHTHPLVSTFFDINQNKSLSEKITFYVDFVEKHPIAESKELEDLMRRIADVAHEAENIMEVHAAVRVHGGESPSILPDLQIIIEDMESIKEEVIKLKEEIGKSPSFLPDLPPPPSSASSAPLAADEATTMVGFDDDARKLLDELIGHHDGRQIISITGMGGIGKTTLAKSLYENSHTKHHFNVRVWITVSQDSSVRNIYLQALSCLGGSVDRDMVDDQRLSDELYKSLYNRRYLIVLDDVWSVEIWDKIKFFFPENNNGSRIVVTTRESKLVDYIGSFDIPLNFLNEKNSWKLFCEKTFPQQGFPPELEEHGKKIVKNCGGLPLAIVVIGGLLGKSPRTQEYWEKVAKDKILILSSEENKPSRILYLSYKYLPVCLKSCFLYLGLYPEDSVIDVDTLIKLWVAEGLIKANRGQSLEEVAESYINDLLDRNLLLLYSKDRWRKRCFIHDLLRDLCIEIGEKEHFYCAQKSIDGDRHFIADRTTTRFYSENIQASRTPSIFNPLIVSHEPRVAPIKTRLLRVLCCDDPSQDRGAFQEVHMRFLQDRSSKFEYGYSLPSCVSQLWSLQSLIVSTSEKVTAPPEIWRMPQLRHIEIRYLSLPDPHPPLSDEDVCVLQDLQTLKGVQNLIFTEEVHKRIPNIKELHIYYKFGWGTEGSRWYHLENLACFNKLESLHFECSGLQYRLLQKIKFPNSLKELILDGCKLEWSYMSVIASLPHLHSLTIAYDALAATEWVFVDEKFISLKHLRIIHCGDVTKWIAECFSFPILEELDIQFMRKLDEIPSGIGEITTLREISLCGCSESANISAVEILYEQEMFANLGLRVVIQTLKAELVRDKIQQMNLTCQNLVIKET